MYIFESILYPDVPCDKTALIMRLFFNVLMIHRITVSHSSWIYKGFCVMVHSGIHLDPFFDAGSVLLKVHF